MGIIIYGEWSADLTPCYFESAAPVRSLLSSRHKKQIPRCARNDKTVKSCENPWLQTLVHGDLLDHLVQIFVGFVVFGLQIVNFVC